MSASFLSNETSPSPIDTLARLLEEGYENPEGLSGTVRIVVTDRPDIAFVVRLGRRLTVDRADRTDETDAVVRLPEHTLERIRDEIEFVDMRDPTMMGTMRFEGDMSLISHLMKACPRPAQATVEGFRRNADHHAEAGYRNRASVERLHAPTQIQGTCSRHDHWRSACERPIVTRAPSGAHRLVLADPILVAPTDPHIPARTLEEAHAQIAALIDTVESLTELVEKVLADNEQLREQLAQRGKSSRNSSKPPSSDSPAQRAGRDKRKRSGRSKGAQAGHEKHERALLDSSEVDQTLAHLPPETCGCGGTIGVDDEPHCRHQVAELPELKHTVTEHQLFGGKCHGCGKRHLGALPEGVPSGQMGPNLIAWIALMGGEMHLSVRQLQRLMLEQWKLSFSTGAISNAMGKASAAMARPHAQIVRAARSAPVAHADETRHPRGGGGYPGTWWMWCLATELAVAFHVHYSRGMAAAAERLGDFGGVLVTDDYGGYNRVPDGRRQLCWAHVLRHFAAIGERVGGGGQIGRRLELIGRAVIRTRHRLDRGEIDECVHHRRMGRLRRRFVLELERGARLRLDGRTKGQCEHLLGRESMLWTFMIDRRIPLTNNLAERGLRPHVIWRKLSHASHSRRGDEFRARVMSVVMTGRNLGVPVYEYLRRICAEANTAAGVTTLLALDTPRLPD